MRQMIAAAAMASAMLAALPAPAVACGFGTCAPCAYAAPCSHSLPYIHTGCGWAYGYSSCGWGFEERLADPAVEYHAVGRPTQYYYVNQGPTFTGPGALAPLRYYEESVVYAGGYGHHRHRAWHERSTYHGQPVLRRYD